MSEDVNMLYMKFPVVLRNKLLSGEVVLPDATVFEYEDILVYRAVARKQDDNSRVDINDFKSYFELNKTPKTPRGVSKDFVSDPHYYGVSSFLQRERVEQIMHFPNPNKKMVRGYVYSNGGPQETQNDGHVCWWLYENVDVSGFCLL